MDFPHLDRLLDVLRHLRGPEGCTWDQSQDLASAARFLSDEVFEYLDAARRGDPEAATAELADLLYMVAYNGLILSETTGVEFDELARRGADKLVRRKPHVFEEDPEARERWAGLSHEEIWRRTKATEDGDDDAPPPTLLKDLHPSVSPLRQAHRHGSDAARGGFDWDSPNPVIAKLHEELDELAEARRADDADAIEDEMGDLLFAAVQLARKLDVDPDAALQRTNAKFARRFRAIEARHGHDPERLRALGITGLWRAWARAKAAERADEPLAPPREDDQRDDDEGSSGQPSSSRSPS
ncbi:MAG TPA: nucleoside triphosphate pyrophosphohydrolase [Candidatus Krumholzibacteria bacterium]|nr:nucleoside triphosphate pyrophosphohydrolase [Candidatus Krumholzibacteria bacterium]